MDRTDGETFTFRFTTRAFATGIPTVLAGSPVLSAMEDAVDTAITTGVTWTASASVTGLNLCTIDASQADFEAGKEYDVYISTGTVDSVSAVGEVVGHFSLSRSAAAVELANGTDGLTALKTTIDALNDVAATDIVSSGAITTLAGAVVNVDLTDTLTTYTGNTLQTIDAATLNDITAASVWAVDATTQQTQGTFGQAIGDPVADTTTIYQSVATDATGDNVAVDIVAVKAETVLIVADTGELQADDVPTLIAAVQSDTDNIQTRLPAALVGGAMDSDVSAMQTNTITAAAVAVGAFDTDAFSAAALLQLGGLLLAGTADAGGNTTNIVDAALTEADDLWTGNWVRITSGTSINQCRLITNFVATSDTLTFSPAVSSAIGAGVTYEIISHAGSDVQSWAGTNAAMLAPNALIGGAVDSDVSAIQAGAITAAAVATDAIDADALATDAVNEIVDQVWNEDATDHQTQGTFGQAIGDPVADATTIYQSVATDATGDNVAVDVVAAKAETVLILADTDDIQTRIPAALVGGAMDSDISAIQANAITAAAIADAAIDNATFAADVGTTAYATNNIGLAANKAFDDALVETTGAPAITGTFRAAWEWMFALSRNKVLQTATLTTLRNDADAADLATSTVSDDATTYTRGEWSV